MSELREKIGIVVLPHIVDTERRQRAINRLVALIQPEIDRAVAEERERLKTTLREHWTEYNTAAKPMWVRATISGTQEFIESILGSP